MKEFTVSSNFLKKNTIKKETQEVASNTNVTSTTDIKISNKECSYSCSDSKEEIEHVLRALESAFGFEEHEMLSKDNTDYNTSKMCGELKSWDDLLEWPERSPKNVEDGGEEIAQQVIEEDIGNYGNCTRYYGDGNLGGIIKSENVGFWDNYELDECNQNKVLLKLNYQEVLDAWSDRGLLVADDCSFFNRYYMGEVPIMEEERTSTREASVQRYKEKRQSRLFSKKIRYQVRKLNADSRPRLKGRFVKRVS